MKPGSRWAITSCRARGRLNEREPIADYRTPIRRGAPSERFNRLHLNLRNEGILISKQGLRCLSTPTGETTVGQFVHALERAVAGLQKG